MLTARALLHAPAKWPVPDRAAAADLRYSALGLSRTDIAPRLLFALGDRVAQAEPLTESGVLRFLAPATVTSPHELRAFVAITTKPDRGRREAP
jgi:hypothetical protein